jgi:N-methylhydantoinase A
VRGLRIGVDAGGTFTDFVVVNEDGEVSAFKIRSNPADPAAVILEGIERAAAGAEAEVVHGSTVATNALLERKGARTGFLCTEGFEDLIHLGRQRREQLYNLRPAPREPLVPRELCFGVRERVHFDGEIGKPLSAAQVKRVAEELRRAGVEAVAICLLHSYINPRHEQLVAEALRETGFVCSSHQISPEYREYERATTTVVNAYVGPLMDNYLAKLERVRGGISILQSNGGSMSVAEARRYPVRTVLSGPAGGVVGAVATARACGFQKVIGFDMGGTSTDVSLALGKPREVTETVVDGIPIRVPMLDIHTVGAGGGSIARVDAGGLLHVGPESAGADPGPACYGSGTAATVTDAHVVLGRIEQGQFLGGDMMLDAVRAEGAVARLGKSAGIDTAAAAAGILRVANSNMQRAIRAISVERGFDPKEFALVAFGGCGGLHACELAEELGMKTVIVPRHAGVLSAVGMLLADRVRDYAAGALERTDHERQFRAMEMLAAAESPGAGLERMADLRYEGQSYELTVPWDAANPGLLFHGEHEQTYGYANPEMPVEVVTLRVRAVGRTTKPVSVGVARQQRGQPRTRRVFTAGRWRRAAMAERESVGQRSRLAGPAIIVDYGATTLILPGWSCTMRSGGNIVLKKTERQT